MGEFPAPLSSDLGVAMVTLQICFSWSSETESERVGVSRSRNRASMTGLTDGREKKKHLPTKKRIYHLCSLIFK